MACTSAPSDPAPILGRVAGGPASWTVEGDGPTVVLVHGLPGSRRDFRWLTPALPGLRVIRVDLPGFGDTPSASAPATAPAFAAHVRATLDAAGVERCVLLAHSFGAGLSALIADQEPDRVAGIALMAPAGMIPHNILKRQRPIRLVGRLAGLRGVGWGMGHALIPLYRQFGFRHATADHARRTFAVLGKYDWAGTVAAVTRLRARALPAWVSWTEDDPIVEAVRAEEWVAALDATPFPFATGGHGLQKTQSVEIGAAVTDFVQEALA
jgi:pimeloyl-ACP methyl ester carboxylesterase